MTSMNQISRNVENAGPADVLVKGVLRDCTPGGKGFRKFKSGDIAVIDAANISRQEAQSVIDMRPSAVINLSRFTTGSIPNYGPHMLLDAGLLLLEAPTSAFAESFKDGKKTTLYSNGDIFFGDKAISASNPLDRAGADRNFSASQRTLVDNMEAFFGNSTQFIHSEGPLLIDGLGIPELGQDFKGRKVLIVTPQRDHRRKIKLLRNFIREYDPVLIGVNEAADTLFEVGYKLDLIVGDPTHIGSETLRSGARVILPADPDGHAPGLERIQDLGVGAMTFPAAVESPADLAVLLADFHEASLIVHMGEICDLDAIFNGSAHATPSALLTRLKAGAQLIEADTVIDLYTVPSSGRGLAWMWAILGILVALATIVCIVGFSGDGAFMDNLEATWQRIVEYVQSWFNQV